MTSSSAARELLQLRLAAQLLAPRTDADRTGAASLAPTASIADVAHRMLAVQAQDFGQGIWALGVRAPGSRRADVAAALDARQVVRSWPMRGTLHFTTPADLHWMLGITAARTIAGAAARHRQLQLDAESFERATAVARAELSGGSLTRDEFFARLAAAGLPTDGQRGVHLIWWLAHMGIVCWGPVRGTQQGLVLLDEWAPATTEMSRADAMHEFVVRYFAGHGPATIKDFTWWSKVPVVEAKAAVALARSRGEIEELVVDGTSFWMAAGAPDALGASARLDGVLALPGFDEYLLGYQDRSHVLPAEFAQRIVPGSNGMFLAMIVSRGVIVGTWRRSIGARAVRATIEPFVSLGSRERSRLERALRGYGRFAGLPVRIDEA